MMDCLLCGSIIQEKLSISKIVSFYSFPEKQCCERCSKLFQSTEMVQVDLKKRVYTSLDQYDHTAESDRLLCYQEVHDRKLILYQNNSFFQDWLYRYQILGDYEIGKVMTEQLNAVFFKNRDSLLFPVPNPFKKYGKIGYELNESLLNFAQLSYVGINHQKETEGAIEDTFYIMNKSSQTEKKSIDLKDRSLILFSIEGENSEEYQAIIDLCFEKKVKQLILFTLA
ncbi:hypothetical protein [Lacticigenium naphthae]|uniref:hypothetical protein n=1 Tax=Lacticigenium naphthae TaxID=515351 RepID=UPI00040694AC|nr:hypothetical protein [Lacticigenium naphthae]